MATPVISGIDPGFPYSTSFSLTENPISEGGRWLDEGINTGRTSVQTGTLPGGGTGAFGTQGIASAPPFLDSVALFKASPVNCFVQATVANHSPVGDQELEFHFRSNCASGGGHYSGYEVNLYLPTVKLSVVRLNDDATHTFDFVVDNIFTNVSMANGAVWKVSMTGSVITAICNSVTVMTQDVNAIGGAYFSTGLCGIGFYRDNSQGNPGNSNELAWKTLSFGGA